MPALTGETMHGDVAERFHRGESCARLLILNGQKIVVAIGAVDPYRWRYVEIRIERRDDIGNHILLAQSKPRSLHPIDIYIEGRVIGFLKHKSLSDLRQPANEFLALLGRVVKTVELMTCELHINRCHRAKIQDSVDDAP